MQIITIVFVQLIRMMIVLIQFKSKTSWYFTMLWSNFGMGETIEERAEIAFELQRIDADSIPCNFLVAVKGTPLEGQKS